MLETALHAAHEAGKILQEYFEMTGLEREMKSDTSFVTEADKKSEVLIANIIREAYPDHGIRGEEGSADNPDASIQWIIDPLDGTSNFANGIPLFGISIGVVENGVPIVGVVHNPITNSLYSAEKGKGAFYNGKQVFVSKQSPEKGLVTMGPAQSEKARLGRMFLEAPKYMKSTRFLGSTALELAYVSRGGTEGYICLGLYPWDYAAGALLVLEAGGTISAYDGSPWTMEQNYFVASNGVCHENLLSLAGTL